MANPYGTYHTKDALHTAVVNGLAEMLTGFTDQGVDFQTAFNMMANRMGANFPEPDAN